MAVRSIRLYGESVNERKKVTRVAFRPIDTFKRMSAYSYNAVIFMLFALFNGSLPIIDMAALGKKPAKPTSNNQRTNGISLSSGSFSKAELEAVLNTLPVDITFVDAKDQVRYFSQSPKRIFVRSNAVIGRKVQQCHPAKSIEKVNAILSDFKAGERNVAEFWIKLKGRMIYIRYFAVRNSKGKYLGCLEVTQDITGIKGIEGEKRLD
jgi:PAS domain S-box-containing protein